MTQATSKPRVHYVRWSLLALAMVALAVGMVWMRWRGLPYGVARSLGTAETYELISVSPRIGMGDYYGHQTFGRATITDPAVRQRLNAALQAAVRESNGSVAACFNPRHAIRASGGGHVTELLVCFECKAIEVFSDGKKTDYIPISSSQESVFDAVLQKAGVPLAPKSH